VASIEITGLVNSLAVSPDVSSLAFTRPRSGAREFDLSRIEF
jgi:hypothetical protein